jgi:hypothetical protein
MIEISSGGIEKMSWLRYNGISKVQVWFVDPLTLRSKLLLLSQTHH